MASPAAASRRIPLIPLVVGSVICVVLIVGIVYLSRPAPTPHFGNASAEAKQYLPRLRLADVSVVASENFMKQQVIEVKGQITDEGPRALRAVDVYCLFYGVNGTELYRERLPILAATGAPLRPGETRAFRLPFDSVPEGWNQAVPKMVIAQIKFAS